MEVVVTVANRHEDGVKFYRIQMKKKLHLRLPLDEYRQLTAIEG